MMREEFVKALEKALSVEALTDLYVSAGMLKLDEPKSAEQRAMESIVPIPVSERSTGAILNALDQAGFKIVEK